MSISCYKIGQAKNPTLRLAFALLTFLSSGEYEPALREWKAKPKTDQTCVKVGVFMQKEFEKHNKQNKTTANQSGTALQTASPTKKSSKSYLHICAITKSQKNR